MLEYYTHCNEFEKIIYPILFFTLLYIVYAIIALLILNRKSVISDNVYYYAIFTEYTLQVAYCFFAIQFAIFIFYKVFLTLVINS